MASSQLTDGSATTDGATGSLTNPGGATFVAGLQEETAADPASTITLDGSQFTENEYSFQSTANASASTTYYMRMSHSGTAMDSYTACPAITVGRGKKTQLHYRWRNDDGDETAATWGANEDTASSTVNLNENKRLRFSVVNEGVASTTDTLKLEYGTNADCASGTWTRLPESGNCGSAPFCMNAGQLVHGSNTTNVASGLTDPSTGSFTAGEQLETTTSTSRHISLWKKDFTEVEYSFQATSNASYSTTYYFRVSGDEGAIDSYNSCAEMTTQDTIAPDVSQNHYRWRNDDGDETAATWGAAEDTASTTNTGSLARLRLSAANTGSGSADNYVYRLEFGTESDCLSGSWNAVADAASCGATAFCMASSQLTDGSSTTNVAGGLTDTGSFTAGEQEETSSSPDAVTVGVSEFTEMEYSFLVTPNAASSTNYFFRITNAGTPLDAYDSCAKLRIGDIAGYRLHHEQGTTDFQHTGQRSLFYLNSTWWMAAQDNSANNWYLWKWDGTIPGAVGVPSSWSKATTTSGTAVNLDTRDTANIDMYLESSTSTVHLLSNDTTVQYDKWHYNSTDDDWQAQISNMDPGLSTFDRDQFSVVADSGGIPWIIYYDSADSFKLKTKYYNSTTNAFHDGAVIESAASSQTLDLRMDSFLFQGGGINYLGVVYSKSDSATEGDGVWKFAYRQDHTTTADAWALETIDASTAIDDHISAQAMIESGNSSSTIVMAGKDNTNSIYLWRRDPDSGWQTPPTEVYAASTRIKLVVDEANEDVYIFGMDSTGGAAPRVIYKTTPISSFSLSAAKTILEEDGGASDFNDINLSTHLVSGVTDIIVASNGPGDGGSVGAGAWWNYIPLEGGPDIDQIHYRWRLDDGDESAASWDVNADTATTSVNLGTTVRLRIELSNEGSASSSNKYVLQYSTSNDLLSGTWNSVPATGSCGNAAFCMASSQLTEGVATTNVVGGLADANDSFIAGEQKESNATTSHISLDTVNFTEIEWSFQVTSNALESTSYYFRVASTTTAGDFGVIDSYSVKPQLTTTGIVGTVDSLTTNKAVYATSTENIDVTGTFSASGGDASGTTIDYVMFFDNDGNGVPSTGEPYITNNCAGSSAWSSGNYTHQTTGFSANDGVPTNDTWECDDSNFPESGYYTLYARWYNGAVEYDTATANFEDCSQPIGTNSWWDTNYENRRILEFNNSDFNALFDFPVLVRASSTNFGFNNTKANGDDLRFIDEDGSTELAYELETWDTSGDMGVVWVKVPKIATSTQCDFISFYYDYSSATTGSSTEAVWDSSYVAVYHMGEGSGKVYDSTSNEIHIHEVFGSPVYQSTGPFGYGMDFNGSGDFLVSATSSALNLTTYSLEFYINMDQPATKGEQVIIAKGEDWDSDIAQYIVELDDAQSPDKIQLWQEEPSDADTYFGQTNTPSPDTWYYYTATRNDAASLLQWYIDGNFDTDRGSVLSPGTNANDVFTIAERRNLTAGVPVYQGVYFDGTLDEIRISSSVRSADWIGATASTTRITYVDWGAEATSSGAFTGAFDVYASSTRSFDSDLPKAFEIQSSTISDLGAIKVVDDRGSDAGWTMNAQGNDWKTTTGAFELDYDGEGSDNGTGKMCVDPAGGTLYAESGSMTNVNKQTYACYASDTSIIDVVVADSGFGTGAYWLTDMSLEQMFPSDATVAVYTTTIILTIQ